MECAASQRNKILKYYCISCYQYLSILIITDRTLTPLLRGIKHSFLHYTVEVNNQVSQSEMTQPFWKNNAQAQKRKK